MDVWSSTLGDSIGGVSLCGCQSEERPVWATSWWELQEGSAFLEVLCGVFQLSAVVFGTPSTSHDTGGFFFMPLNDSPDVFSAGMWM